MSTVVARIELSQSSPDKCTIYYRIYKGHNRRLEFSSRLRIPVSLWDKTEKTVIGDTPEVKRIRIQMERDLALLNKIIEGDADNTMPMKDIEAVFKKRRKVLKQRGKAPSKRRRRRKTQK